VRAPAVWSRWEKPYFGAKVTKLEPLAVQGLGFSIPMGRFDGNFFRGLGFDKPLLNDFARFFLHHVHDHELALIYDLFQSSDLNEPPMFYLALENNKLVLDIYLKMIIHA